MMKALLFAILIAVFPLTLEAQSRGEVETALNGLAAFNGFPLEDGVLEVVDGYYALPEASSLDEAAIVDLLTERGAALWSGQVAEFSSLSEILFKDSPAAHSAASQKAYSAYQATLERWRDGINTYIRSVHPGLRPLAVDALTQEFQGEGISIAVFDVFDPELLKSQSATASIDEPVVFGKPVELSHGNVVIDQILSLAPKARIIPFWADSKDYTNALLAIEARKDIAIVNISRGLLEARDKGQIDPAFLGALLRVAKSRIVIKALGNTGTDLAGKVTPKRESLGLGAVNNLASYDAGLIAKLGSVLTDSDLLLFAMNDSLFGRDYALSATIPGDDPKVWGRTLGLPAEGVWSPSTQTFESGSSFAAPQLAGLMALLMERMSGQAPLAPSELKELIHSLKSHAFALGDPKVFGLGLPRPWTIEE